jgi:hypothetical protein
LRITRFYDWKGLPGHLPTGPVTRKPALVAGFVFLDHADANRTHATQRVIFLLITDWKSC